MLLAITALLPLAADAKIVYVDGRATGLNNGTSWNNAFRNLQDAIAQAVAGDEIWVAQGTYRPDRGAGQVLGDRKASFRLKSAVKLYGGYAGFGQPKPNARDVQGFPTILSGDLNGNDAPIPSDLSTPIRQLVADPSRQDNAYVVVTAEDTDQGTLLDGFVIKGGLANANQWPLFYAGQGAGMFVLRGSVTIRSCTFTDNLATAGGAGLVCRQASPVIEDCTFIKNYSLNYGGAISAWTSGLTVRRSIFQANRSDDNYQEGTIQHWSGFGGAIFAFDNRMSLTGCRFEANGGCHTGGAITNDHNSNAELVDCTFIANMARGSGGAVENTNGSTMTLTSCVFLQNSASDRAGALWNNGQSILSIARSRFHGNGGTLIGGAIHGSGQGQVTIINSVFTGNIAQNLGGAVSLDASELTTINCSFFGNKAQEGAAIGCDSDNPPASESKYHIFNCILWDMHEEVASKDGSSGVLIYTDIFDPTGGWLVWANEHNKNVDPRFVDPDGADDIVGTEDDNLRLMPGSPCIDAGANARVPEGVTMDLDGKARFVDDPDTIDTGTGLPPVVDMGAYEYVKKVPGPGKPIANAGPDQTVFAWLDELARLTLDGSASSDPDGDELTYSWTWRVGTNNYQATGVRPEIVLPVGTFNITLVVNDGRQNSSPDTVVITVLGPFTAKTSVQPETIQRNDPRQEYVTVLMLLSQVAASDIDHGQPLIMTPGQIPALAQSAFDWRDGQTFMTLVNGTFLKDALMQAIPTNGATSLTITGRLTSGRSFSGSAPVTIVGTITPDISAPVPNPMEWALADPAIEDVNDPRHWPGEPRAVLLDPRADNGTGETGWAIAMRATIATHQSGGIQYQFDCFEDDSLDRNWSADPNYVTRKMKRTDVVKYTFRCRARNAIGGTTAWSKWAWVREVPNP